MEAIDLVQLLGMEKRYPHQLSGGQQQRVALARAIVVRPQLVLFDEPMSALDALLREEMRIELMDLVRNIGFTAIYVTHDQIEAMSMSDEIVVMQSGVILQKTHLRLSIASLPIRLQPVLLVKPIGWRQTSGSFALSISVGNA